jgi:O-antigen/teichoic acid export membrane protein
VVVRQVSRREDLHEFHWHRDRAVSREIFRYSLPRSVMAGMEQAILWLDVVLVGSMLGSTQSGIYGSAARFVSAGMIVLTALRIVVAPRFSAMLAAREIDALSHLYLVTTRWIVLFGTPVYLTLAIFAPTVLAWFGGGFGSGAHSMTVLCVGSIATLVAGNVQSLLLMSGRSGWGAFNKMVVVVVNVTGNLLAIPHWGIQGAAVVWALSMALDTALAAYQVRRGLGVSPALGAIAGTVLAVGGCVAAPALAVVAVAGQGSVQLVVAALLAGLVLGSYCVLDRRRLRLDELATVRDRGRRTSLKNG